MFVHFHVLTHVNYKFQFLTFRMILFSFKISNTYFNDYINFLFAQCTTTAIRYDSEVYEEIKKFILIDFQIIIHDL